jgi:type IV secretion system protein VirD4
MVSRQETARPLLTPGEVMQLPHNDELALVSGCQPIRAKKARYYKDAEMKPRILPPPTLSGRDISPGPEGLKTPPEGDWANAIVAPSPAVPVEDPANAGIRREPQLPEHEEIEPEPRKATNEFEPVEEDDDEPQRRRMMQQTMGAVARQISLDTGDDMHVTPMRTKHTFRLPPYLMGKLADYAARKGVTQSLVAEAPQPPISRRTGPIDWKPRSPGGSIE